MHYPLLLSLIFALCFSGNLFAVGFQHVTVSDPDDRPIETGIWYPVAATEPHTPNTPFQQNLAIDAPPIGINRALVILSHGYGGGMGSHASTAKALAEAGFIAVALTHTGNNFRDETYPLSRWLLDRPRHVSRVLDYMHRQWPYRHLLDLSKTAAFGFSAGGYTIMALAGAIPDASTASNYCRQNPEDFVCSIGIVSTLTSREFRQLSANQWGRDARISVGIALAPGLAFTYNKHSLKGVNIPLQIWSAEFDRQVPDAHNGRLLQRLLPQKPDYRYVQNAGHYAFLRVCNPKLETHNPTLWARICVDRPGFDRKAFHAELDQTVIDFLQAQFND